MTGVREQSTTALGCIDANWELNNWTTKEEGGEPNESGFRLHNVGRCASFPMGRHDSEGF